MRCFSSATNAQRWPTSATLQACPTSALAGGSIAQLDATTLANAIKAALANALFPGSNAVSDVTLATDSLTITAAAPASSTYTYSVIEVRTATAAAGAAGRVICAATKLNMQIQAATGISLCP
jgi:hypothetical protein